MRDIGIFGGTFDPIHIGHLRAADCLRRALSLEKVLFVTSKTPPHKSGVLDAEERHAMVSAAVAGNPYFEASRVDLDRDGFSSEIEILKILRAQYGEGYRFNLIISAEYLAPDYEWNITRWETAEELFHLSRVIVCPRGNITTEQAREWAKFLPASTVEVIDCPVVPVSSSIVRRAVNEGGSIDHLVLPPVSNIIARKGFYRGALPAIRPQFGALPVFAESCAL